MMARAKASGRMAGEVECERRHQKAAHRMLHRSGRVLRGFSKESIEPCQLEALFRPAGSVQHRTSKVETGLKNLMLEQSKMGARERAMNWMGRYRIPGRAAIIALAITVAGPALAHHGWSWTEDTPFELKGTITDIYIGNPHATLDVDSEGAIWHVELAPPARTIAAGFTEGTAKKGDEVTAIGNRSKDPNEKRMIAARIIVGGKKYDVYPDHVPTN
jgi:hypothetical protein